jgi:hypothetical protein
MRAAYAQFCWLRGQFDSGFGVARVHVLSPGFETPNGGAFLFPLVVWHRALAEGGIDLKIHATISDSLTDCDVLVIDSKFHRDRWKFGVEPVVKEFVELKRRSSKLVYFDTTDSTGCLQAELLPVVDLYCKNQILHDRAEYMRPHYGQRIYADYYYRTDGIEDTAPLYSNAVADRTHLSKLRVGWNSGLANYSTFGPYWTSLYRRLPLPPILRFSQAFVAPGKDRPIALQSRFGLGQGRESVTHQRRRIAERLAGRVPTEKLRRLAYFEELTRSWAVLSPFGLGEITLKDFEVFLTGGLLVKPSIDHVETWPDLFQDGETMISFQWDLSDLAEVLDRIEADRSRYLPLAIEGQRRYRDSTVGTGAAERFCTHVKQVWLH